MNFNQELMSKSSLQLPQLFEDKLDHDFSHDSIFNTEAQRFFDDDHNSFQPIFQQDIMFPEIILGHNNVEYYSSHNLCNENSSFPFSP